MLETYDGLSEGVNVPRPRLHFLREGRVTRFTELPIDLWIASLAFDGARAALLAALPGRDEDRFELWLVPEHGARARTSLEERDGLHELFSPDGRELLVFTEQAPGLLRYRLDVR